MYCNARVHLKGHHTPTAPSHNIPTAVNHHLHHRRHPSERSEHIHRRPTHQKKTSNPDKEMNLTQEEIRDILGIKDEEYHPKSGHQKIPETIKPFETEKETRSDERTPQTVEDYSTNNQRSKRTRYERTKYWAINIYQKGDYITYLTFLNLHTDITDYAIVSTLNSSIQVPNRGETPYCKAMLCLKKRDNRLIFGILNESCWIRPVKRWRKMPEMWLSVKKELVRYNWSIIKMGTPEVIYGNWKNVCPPNTDTYSEVHREMEQTENKIEEYHKTQREINDMLVDYTCFSPSAFELVKLFEPN